MIGILKRSCLTCMTGLMIGMLILSGACSEEKVKLYVINAGSLVVPFAEIEKAYEEKYPGVDVLLEGHGSIQVIRQVTELDRLVDIVAVADWSLIPMMMYTAEIDDSGEPYTDWVMNFASNRLGLTYSSDSLYADEINEGNWFDILARQDVVMGYSDPRFDSSGYRTFMLIKMAEDYYDKPDLFQELVIDNFRAEIRVEEGTFTTIVIPELLQTTVDRVMLRGSSVQLLNLLESREIDYAFEYESVAIQRDLEFLPLPLEIDMSSMEFADRYGHVRVKLDFQRFASVQPVFSGLPIVYGITIPANAPNFEEAERFIRFLTGEEGQEIFARNYQPILVPPEVDIIDKTPEGLRPLLN